MKRKYLHSNLAVRYAVRFLPRVILYQAVLFLAFSSPLYAEAIFKNSVVSNDIDFIRSDDPSIAFEVIESGRARKEMPDKRTEALFADDVFVFQIKYEDGTRVAVWASPDFEDGDSAAHFASLVGAALGKFPAPLRRKLSHVVIHSGDEVAFAEEGGRFFVLYSENMKKRVSQHDLEETVFHETIHATLEREHAVDPGWIAAQKSDPGFITEYAAQHPEKEDLPESALFAYTLATYPERLPVKVKTAILEIMPNRFEYLRQLFESLKTAEAREE